MNATRALADKLSQARRIIDRAEDELGNLSDGMRRDLLKDNTRWTSDEVATLVAALSFERFDEDGEADSRDIALDTNGYSF